MTGKVDHELHIIEDTWKSQCNGVVQGHSGRHLYPANKYLNSLSSNILERLKLDNPALPPPPVMPVKPPITDVSALTISDRSMLMSAVRGNVDLLIECAKYVGTL